MVFWAMLFSGCNPERTLRGIIKKETPHQKYLSRLQDAKLDQTALGQKWIAASNSALQTPVSVTLPFKETGYFPADKPLAASYQFTLKRGQKVTVRVQMQGTETPQVFVDLFETNPNDPTKPKNVASADTTGTELEYEIEEELPHLIRLQPELLRSGQYTITLEAQPTLAFPVQGHTSKAIQSFWGAMRDGGVRNHEGIDIFAARSTPVVAAVAGTVTRVNTTPIGGKVVWLLDRKRQQSLYYAHLDSQLVQAGQRVEIGDTLGLVGNTGNAKTTPPHLHFGIYRSGQGAVNPLPYVKQDSNKPGKVKVSTAHFNSWGRIGRSNVTLRQSPSTAAPALLTLPLHAPVFLLAGASNWYKVTLPLGQVGYVAEYLVETIEKPLQTLRLANEVPLLEAADAQAAMKEVLAAGAKVQVLAKMQDFWLVQNLAGLTGWIHPQASN